jgi:hypothetical protein
MKTLLIILILFACLGVNGQVDTVFYDIGKGLVIDNYEKDQNYHLITLEDMEVYIQECYNDSTLTHTHIEQQNEVCYCRIGNLAIGYDWELCCEDRSHFTYTHRKPTFEGFYKYLKRKRDNQ